ncbi:DUF934 domain-containing protein [Sandarakinorhabdus oryzae]|uniref:DUF934 domain-containing protein n=1 Tax=Sandarakinorhabdus oryzae TaxID=2675220 RepID=UPI0012E32E5E|nr:DUF934 domain-containing protein [Sandarakinorhabdus oryzae]
MAEVYRLRTDPEHTAPAVPLTDYQPGGTAVQLEPDEDARLLVPHLGALKRIDISFPKFREGRGYSSARILREAGFTGEIRAVGVLYVDQLSFLVRAGFDAVLPETPIDPAVAERTLTRFPFVYMKATDGLQPVWALREQASA